MKSSFQNFAEIWQLSAALHMEDTNSIYYMTKVHCTYIEIHIWGGHLKYENAIKNYWKMKRKRRYNKRKKRFLCWKISKIHITRWTASFFEGGEVDRKLGMAKVTSISLCRLFFSRGENQKFLVIKRKGGRWGWDWVVSSSPSSTFSSLTPTPMNCISFIFSTYKQFLLFYTSIPSLLLSHTL